MRGTRDNHGVPPEIAAKIVKLRKEENLCIDALRTRFGLSTTTILRVLEDGGGPLIVR